MEPHPHHKVQKRLKASKIPMDTFQKEPPQQKPSTQLRIMKTYLTQEETNDPI